MLLAYSENTRIQPVSETKVSMERLKIEVLSNADALSKLHCWRLTQPMAVQRAQRAGLLVVFDGVAGAECLDAVVTLGKEIPAIGLVVAVTDVLCGEALCLQSAYDGLLRKVFTDEVRAASWVQARALALALSRKQPVLSLEMPVHKPSLEPIEGQFRSVVWQCRQRGVSSSRNH